MRSDVDVSVVICHHVGTLVYDAVKSVQTSTDIQSYEIIVMTSDDELAAKGIPGCLTFNHDGLPAAKRNAGVRIAKGKYIAFFDDDVTVDPLCLYHLKNGIKDDVAMTYGRLWNMEHRNRFDEAGGYLTSTGFIWSRAGQNDIDDGQYSKDELIFSGKSASCMIRADVYKKLGGMDEDFGILGEESDLSWRVWLSGQTVMYTPQATGFHAFNTKFKPKEKHYTNERVFFNGCHNYITMLIKNLEAKNLWRILPIHLTIWFSAGVVMIITGKVKQGVSVLKGLVFVIRNLKSILEKRRRVQSDRQVSDDDIWPYIFRRTNMLYYVNRFYRYIVGGLHG